MDFEALKAKQHHVWSSGNYSVIGTTFQIVGERLCEAVDIHAGAKVLDVAAGNGNATLAAARRYGDVVSTDFVAELLERGRARADAEGLRVHFQVADAEALPFGDATFDYVLSTFGVIFAPNHARSSSELLRVCKSGGKIGLACWTPEGYSGQMFKTLAKYRPPTPGAPMSSSWGTQMYLEKLFGAHATIAIKNRHFIFRYPSPEAFVEISRNNIGPMLTTFSSLDEANQRALTADMLTLIASLNRNTDGTMAVPSEYLEIVITKH